MDNTHHGRRGVVVVLLVEEGRKPGREHAPNQHLTVGAKIATTWDQLRKLVNVTLFHVHNAKTFPRPRQK